MKKHSGGYLTVLLNKKIGESNNIIRTNGTNFSYRLPKYEQTIVSYLDKNLLTNGGRDLFHAQDYTNTTAGTRGAGCVAVSTGTTNETATSTVLETEISTNGLQRADATTKTHTAATNSTLIEHTFTASGTHTAVHKSATFNATSSGTMCHVANFASDATLVSGDTLKVSWTLNLG